jgi:hypothetical protein
VNVTFQDLERPDNPRNGTTLNGITAVSDLLASFAGRAPFIFELRGQAGYTLTVGFGGTLGCVQYSAADGTPPYMVAVADTPSPTEPRYFLAGGQETEIPGRFCMPIDRVRDIVAEFVATGAPSLSAAWEEV